MRDRVDGAAQIAGVGLRHREGDPRDVRDSHHTDLHIRVADREAVHRGLHELFHLQVPIPIVSPYENLPD